MSFEADQARLVKELADAQEEIRGQYGLPPRPAKKDSEPQPTAASHGKRSSFSSL